MLFGIAVAASFFAILETVLTIAGVEPLSRREDPFVGFSAQAPLFTPQRSDDGRVTWITSPNKRRWFNLQQFPAAKGNDTFRIFCLGGSTTYGRPYADATSFCGWLRALLTKGAPGRHWEVINAGGISYASHRIVTIAQELADYRPDLLIVYMGHNEFLEERTYRSIKRVPQWLRRVGSQLCATRIYAAADHLLRPARSNGTNAGRTDAEVTTKLDNGVGPDAYTRDEGLRRKILDAFRLNLQRIVRIGRDAGAAVILITPASNLADCSPFKSQHREGLQEAERQRWNEAMQAARRLRAAGRFEQALGRLDQAARIDPRRADLHYLRGRLLIQEQRYGQAKEALVRARDEDVCPLRAVSPIVTTVREVAQAQGVPLVDFERLVAQRSEHGIPGASMFLDHVHPTIAGHRMLAVAILEQMDRLDLLGPGAAWDDALIAQVTRDVESRIDRRAQGLALRNLAKVLTWAGKREEAHRLALRAAALVSNDAETHVLAGNALLKKGDAEAAVQEFRKALAIDPRQFQALNSLGAACHRLGRLDEAIECYQRVLELKPDFAPVHNNLGAIYQRQSKLDQARRHYRRAIEINPRYADAYNNLSVVWRREGNLDQAARCCLQALEIRPDYAEAHFNLGRIRAAQGHDEAAVRAFRRAIEVAPDYGPAYYGLALQWERQGDLKAAVANYRRAIEHRGTPRSAVSRLAWLLATAENASLRDGKQSFRLANTCAQATRFSDGETLSILAAACAELGQFDRAIQWQRKALRIAAPGTRDLHRARLERLLRRQPLRGPSGLGGGAAANHQGQETLDPPHPDTASSGVSARATGQ